MNENTTIAKPGERQFAITLLGKTRTVVAPAYMAAMSRIYAPGYVAVRYRSGHKLHQAGFEIVTDPAEVAKLVKAPYNWSAGDGFAWRINSHRRYGNFKSSLRVVGWAADFKPEDFA